MNVITQTQNSQVFAVTVEELNSAGIGLPRSQGALPETFTIPKDVEGNLVIVKYNFSGREIKKPGVIIDRKTNKVLTISQLEAIFYNKEVEPGKATADDIQYVFPAVKDIANRLEMPQVDIFKAVAGKTFTREKTPVDAWVGANFVTENETTRATVVKKTQKYIYTCK